jgi:glucokinase
VATVLDPGMVLIGGGLTDAAGVLIVGPARAAFGASASLREVRPAPPVRRAALGNAAGLVGAAALASLAEKRSKPHEPEMVTRW